MERFPVTMPGWLPSLVPALVTSLAQAASLPAQRDRRYGPSETVWSVSRHDFVRSHFVARQHSQAVLCRFQRRRLASPKIEIRALIELHIAPLGGFADLQNFIGVHVVPAQQPVAVLRLAQGRIRPRFLPLRENTQGILLGRLVGLSSIGWPLLDQLTRRITPSNRKGNGCGQSEAGTAHGRSSITKKTENLPCA